MNDQGIKSFLVREHDETLSLYERTARAYQNNADCFISIHANASSSIRMSGMEALCLSESTRLTGNDGFLSLNAQPSNQAMSTIDHYFKKNLMLSHKLAQDILSNVTHYLKADKRYVKSRGIKYNGWQTLLQCNIPATIFEAEFITNPQGATRISDNAHQEVLSYGIAQGISRFLLSIS